MNEEQLLSVEKNVSLRGGVVLRPMEPWSGNIHKLLRHFYDRGLQVPQMIGVSPDGREMLEYLHGELVHPNRWSEAGLYEVGKLVRRLHNASSDFPAPADGLWKPWCLRELGSDHKVYSHGDIAPWNMLTKSGLHTTLIDWEMAGPIDPVVELARVCWLFPQLVDDDLGELYKLPPANERAAQVRMICDAYGLPSALRRGFVNHILEVVICETAHEAIDPGLTTESFGNLWGFAWRTRSLYWIWRHRAELEKAMK